MQIDQDRAMQMAAARKRMRVCRAGEGWILIPYMEGKRFADTHYLPDIRKSVQCGGPSCQWHHYPLVAKLHVPAYVGNRKLRYDEAKAIKTIKGEMFSPAAWHMQIVELTEGVFATAIEPHDVGTVAVLLRPPGRQNMPLEFRWLRGQTVKGSPKDIAITVEQILPAVIHGTYFDAAEIALDKSGETPTKHKIPYLPVGVPVEGHDNTFPVPADRSSAPSSSTKKAP